MNSNSLRGIVTGYDEANPNLLLSFRWQWRKRTADGLHRLVQKRCRARSRLARGSAGCRQLRDYRDELSACRETRRTLPLATRKLIRFRSGRIATDRDVYDIHHAPGPTVLDPCSSPRDPPTASASTRHLTNTALLSSSQSSTVRSRLRNRDASRSLRTTWKT